MTNAKNGNLKVALIIIAASGIFVLLAVYFAPNKAMSQEEIIVATLDLMRPVTSDDHIRGDINAPVKIVEYSDTECPFCKKFHRDLKNALSQYEESGKVASVYRHFPIDSNHPIKARKEAEATECARELGGNEKFWEYIDRLYEITPSNNKLDLALLPKIAEEVGLDAKEFNACLESGKHKAYVEKDYQDAVATGGNGTPWSIIVDKNGKKYPLSGAQSEATIKQLIELALDAK
ncbi:MAG: DsbA family protein [Patescibacteria group bacterium]